MMLSASNMRRRTELAARNTCRTMQTTEDPDEKWPNTSAETRDAYRATMNFLAGTCACGLPLGETPMYFCPMHPCCITCADDGPHTMRKSRHSNTCKINGCDCELAAVATRNLKAEEQSAFVKEMADKLRESLEREQHRDTAGQDARDEAMGRDPAARAGRSDGKVRIGEIDDPDEKAEAQAAAKETRDRLAKEKRVKDTRGDLEILLDHSIQMHVVADHPEAPNLVAKKRQIDDFVENGPPKKKGGRRPKTAAAAAAGPSSAPMPAEDDN